MASERLLRVEDSVLCVIDAQPGFADELKVDERERAVQRIVWIAALARMLDVATVVTEEEPDRYGPTIPD